MLLNDDGYVEAALGLANRVLRERSDDDVRRRLEYAFRLVLVREPTQVELQTLAGFFDEESKRFASDPSAASAMIGSIAPEVPRPDGHAPAEIAAWVQTARVILNLDEVVSRG